MSADTLLCGAVLPGHDVAGPPGPRPMKGDNVPWNTLAVWDLDKLNNTRFLGTSDHDAAGVEEAACAALIQTLCGVSSNKVKLVSVPGVVWDVGFGEERGREEWQERKMRSKRERAERQCGRIGVKGEVHVIK
eukprot:CAMPEP_0182459894 /NCGR_PEP_ID=MMETSP1319-20130603/4919_1 /TAXON_ID=172717 /ORGANISM="Bolidomonas pacifica, Strain RCC208" /LENGTH=132 /DNA_ID=CAMNT_0024658911 /DNA_START=593 /DNA_END=991 /DNA_ORIENTATION=-